MAEFLVTYKIVNFDFNFELKNKACFKALMEFSDPSIGTRIFEYNNK